MIGLSRQAISPFGRAGGPLSETTDYWEQTDLQMFKSEVAALPVALALVICDSVYQDREGKRALVGLFSRIVSPAFPTVQSQMCVYVSLASVRAENYCRLEIVSAETDVSVVSMEGMLPVSPRSSVCDVVFEMCDVRFDQPGIYFVRFWGSQERVLIERPIEVMLPIKEE